MIDIGVDDSIRELITGMFPNHTGIIYTCTIREADSLAAYLQSHNISADAYHARLSDSERVRRQTRWLNDETHVMVATVAFGMGIHKADVRYVVHYSMPKSIEALTQESGRAGRDGKQTYNVQRYNSVQYIPAPDCVFAGENSWCVVYYSYSDRKTHEYMLEKSRVQGQLDPTYHKYCLTQLNKVIEYCQNMIECRRVMTLRHFDEPFTSQQCNNSCDVRRLCTVPTCC